MVRLISVALFAFAVFATQAFAQQIELSVDRNELARGETLTLTIRVCKNPFESTRSYRAKYTLHASSSHFLNAITHDHHTVNKQS